jgi:predicted nucleic-acid-binding protein
LKITPDTNVLLRPLVRDEAAQARIAETVLRSAALVAISTPSLCELAWVLRQGYKKKAEDIAAAMRELISVSTVNVDRAAVEAGIAMLEAGGDFADGVIAFEGRRNGGVTFVSFDRNAVKKVKASGGSAKCLTPD